jgi:type VI secretion system secreted protein VgrG
MFSPANQTQLFLEIPGIFNDFQVLQFKGREALNDPYSFEIELISGTIA